jgi:hypothetical protein
MDSRSLLSSDSGSDDSPYPVDASITKQASSLEAAVEMLRKRDPDDLKRARRHHRRALTALKGGCYDALGGTTRTQLIQRLTADLEAINRALKAMAGDGAAEGSADPPTGRSSWGGGGEAPAESRSGRDAAGPSSGPSGPAGRSSGDGAAADPASVSLFRGPWRAARWIPSSLR